MEINKMANKLDNILLNIGNAYKENISKDSRHYLEVSIAKQAQEMGFTDIDEEFEKAYVIVPLKQPVRGMKVRIDGRTFVNYGQLETGVAVPGYVIKKSRLPHKNFVPNHSMILNVT
jgi:hypothetical protein